MTEIEALAATSPDPASTNWVPMWNLNGGVNVVYDGDWASGRTYQPGEIVVLGGVTYMCVRQTTNRPTSWATAVTMPTYGTTLPASPVDGQEHVLVDSVAAPTYQLRFRYNAQNTGTNKWEFIGGSGPHIESGAGWPMTGDSQWHQFGPTITVPRPGLWRFTGMIWGTTGANAGNVAVGVCVAGAAPTFNGGQTSVPASAWFSLTHFERALTLAGGNTVAMGYYATAAAMNISVDSFTLTPVAIS